MIPLAAFVFIAGMAGGVLVVWKAHHALEPVVRVNGAIIDREMLRRRLADVANKRSLVGVMIEDEEALQFARAHGAYPTASEIDGVLRAEQSKPDFAHTLALSGQLVADLKSDILIRQARLNSVTKGVTVSEADVRRFYEANINPRNPGARYYTPESAQVAVIVTTGEAAGKLALAELDRGMPFAAVARKYSQDSSWEKGGLLPRFERGRTLANRVAGLEEMVFGARPGETVGPRKLGGVWWIILCVEKKPASVRRFDDVKEDCAAFARLEAMNPAAIQSVEHEFEQFKQAARVQAFQPEYRDLMPR